MHASHTVSTNVQSGALPYSNCLQTEETERRSIIAEGNTQDPSQDLVKLRRMTLSIQSIPRSLDLHAAVGTAAQRAVSVVGQEALSDVSLQALC